MSVGATWVGPDPAAVLAALGVRGGEPADVDDGSSLAVAAGRDERLVLGAPADGHLAGRAAGLVAVGIATVDAERLAARLASPPSAGPDRTMAPLPVPAWIEDAWLGARAWTLAAGQPVPLVLLEPTTEGRLAGALARVGEGPLVAWVRGRSGPRQAVPPGTLRATALGLGVVARSGGRWGPYLVALVASTGPGERSATIAP